MWGGSPACMYVCMCACVCVCVCACMNIEVCSMEIARVWGGAGGGYGKWGKPCVCVYVCFYVSVFVHVCKCVCMYKYLGM